MPNIVRHAVLALLLLVPFAPAAKASAHPASTESAMIDRCEEAGSGVERYGCYRQAAAQSRKRVQWWYLHDLRAAEKVARDYTELAKQNGMPATKLVLYLKASQKSWLAYVREQCRYEGERAFGGSGGDIFNEQCHHRMNLQRIAELKAARIRDN